MTLITYPTRVHFADHVLEEALHSELESAGCRQALLIADGAVIETDLADRVRSGVPQRVSNVAELVFNAGADLEKVLHDPLPDVDVIIAFGTARAIELGRRCRNTIASRTGVRPRLFAIPGIDGLPNPSTRSFESWRTGLPSVLICDPTVSLHAGQGASLRSCVLSLVRCVESYLAGAYNPLADGIALEGVSRCVINLPKISDKADIALHRELMAAGLNAALAQEKGIGPALAMSVELAKTTEPQDEAAIARLLLPAVMENRALDDDKQSTLRKVLGEDNTSLDQVMRRLLRGLPMPATLEDMGIPRNALDDAARATTGKAGMTYDRALKALESNYEKAWQ